MAAQQEYVAHPITWGFRPMTEADVPAVVRIERAAYQFPWSEGIFRDCLRVGYQCCLAVQDATVGYAVMSACAGEAHILNLCVQESARNRGLGRALLTHMLRSAAAAGMTDAFLEVRPSNAIAARLYRSVGFEQIGTRRGYYQAAGGREDAAVLRLRLKGWLALT
ncbi:MAG TPA: ribosomal protein S18-alanine N-acetyltransferase [Steroidobacteraceae bacterium]|nr:ribosomal protein S18-alanine N-acetyltransferase [Steroidobacteraceae bacterium]